MRLLGFQHGPLTHTNFQKYNRYWFSLFMLFSTTAGTSQGIEKFTVLPQGYWHDSPNSSSISGYHLMCCCPEFPGVLKVVRDANGSTIATGGIEGGLLDWLSHEYHLTFECSPQNTTFVESNGKSFGLIHYLESGECEMIVSPLVMRHDRFMHFDYLQPPLQVLYVMLIPTPQVTFTNIEAIWKPFQPQVWVALFAFIALTPLVLAAMNSAERRMENSFCHNFKSYAIFVLQNLVSQSASAPLSDGNKKLKMRLILGAWCLLSLWMTTAYSSVLVSFVMAPHYKPLVDTVDDLAHKGDVNPLVMTGLGTNITISGSNDTRMKAIAEKLHRDPLHNFCPNLTACVQQVKHGRSNVFIHVLEQIGMGIHEDLVKTGKCNFAYAKEYFSTQYVGWGIRKGHHLTEQMNRGMLRVSETGLFNEWRKRNQPNSDERCNTFRKSRYPGEKQDLTRLSLSNLMGPFAILLVGFVSSLLIFGAEILIHFFRLAIN